MKAFKVFAIVIAVLIIIALPLAVSLGVVLVAPDAPLWLVVVASLCSLTSVVPVMVGAVLALSVGDPDATGGRKVVRRLITVDILVVGTGILAMTIAALAFSRLALLAAGFIAVSIALSIAAPLVGVRIWRYESTRLVPDHADDLIGPDAEARRRRALIVWFAGGIFVGALFVVALALALQGGTTSDPPDLREIATFIVFPLVMGCFGAALAGFRSTLAFARLAARVAGQDSESNKRIQKAIVRGRDTLVDDEERERAAHLAQIAVVSLPWTYRQSGFLLVGVAGVQLPTLLRPAASGISALALGVISLFVVLALVVTPFAVRNYRNVRAYAAAHPFPASGTRPLPSGPDQP